MIKAVAGGKILAPCAATWWGVGCGADIDTTVAAGVTVARRGRVVGDVVDVAVTRGVADSATVADSAAVAVADGSVGERVGGTVDVACGAAVRDPDVK